MPPEESALQRFVHSLYESRSLPRYGFKKLRIPVPFRDHNGLRGHGSSDYDFARAILKRHETYRTPAFVKEAMGRFIGRSLIMDEGKSWLSLHNVMVKFFQPKAVAANIMPVVKEESDKMINRWLGQKLHLDAEHEMRGLTARVMMRVIFGDGGTMPEQDGAEIIEAASVQLQSFRSLTGLGKIFRAAGQRPLVPGVSAAIEESERVINARLNEAIDRRRKEGPQGGDILDNLISARDPETGAPFDDLQIKDNLLMFIVAGHETTAVALTFALYELLRNPRELEVIRQEIDMLSPPGRPLRTEDEPKMVRIGDAFRESMRLHPSAYEIGRESRVDEIIHVNDTLGDIEIRKGDLVLLDLRKMHRDPEYFPDPEAYRPERFRAYPRTSPRGYMPFGADVRVCLAPNMAMPEGKYALADIFKNVNLQVTQWPLGEEPAFTMRLKGNLLFNASGRSP